MADDQPIYDRTSQPGLQEVQKQLAEMFSKRVQEVELFNSRTGANTAMTVDAIFVAVGYDPAVGLARAAGVELTEEGFIKQDAHHRTNIPGIYSAGDVEGGYKQIITAAGQGSEAALIIFEDLINPYWKKQQQSEL